ncbi:hypothetical protein NCS52_01495700 [Fusarium sp. LHS14.1]|nr:hypothetical protein NCS52_01495700 [Fusarium sp. LHS14.1]
MLNVKRATSRELDDLGRYITNSNRNAIVRLENSEKIDENSAIAPLVNVTTGEEISRFPATLSDIDDLRAYKARTLISAANVVRILGELWLPADKTERVKRKMLMQAFGLTVQLLQEQQDSHFGREKLEMEAHLGRIWTWKERSTESSLIISNK